MTDDFDFGALSGNKAVDETRAFQLLLWWLEEDHALLLSAAVEIEADPRGLRESLWEVSLALVGMLGAKWLAVTDDEEALRAAIRVEIAKLAGGVNA
jgi:hypothetical protein